MPRGQVKLFECVECGESYTKKDVLEGRYFPRTRVCRRCYRKMAKAHPKIFCFGKEVKGKLPGFSEKNEVCQKLCPDKEVCEQFIEKHKEK